MTSQTLKRSIQAQRAILRDWLADTMVGLTTDLPDLLNDVERLDGRLYEIFHQLEQCKYVFVLDAQGRQVSATVNRYGADTDQRGRDRADRPYMTVPLQQPDERCFLSEAYISSNKKRPSLTAIQTLYDSAGQHVGYFGADFDLRELPHAEVMYEAPTQWQQIKGDPAIRQGLFTQSRVESMMDNRIDDILSLHEELVLSRGIHHFQMHFSSSRTTLWQVDDPYVYHNLTVEDLLDTNTILAYPIRAYFERSVVPSNKIAAILKQFKALRFADETIYLRSASLNIVNGSIGLNFSCDGTHYLSFDEFLQKGLGFWFGKEEFPHTVVPAPVSLDLDKLDGLIEEIAGSGCMQVNKLLYALDKEQLPEQLADLSTPEREYVQAELKSVMDVYEGEVCSI